MTAPRRYTILVAVQFDDTGAHALREATRIARRDRHADLHVLHVIANGSRAEHRAESAAQRLAYARSKLRNFVARACAGTWFRVVCHIRTGTPSDAVVEAAASVSADLIVVGTHDRSDNERALLGSVSEAILRRASCPVLVAVKHGSHVASCGSSGTYSSRDEPDTQPIRIGRSSRPAGQIDPAGGA